MKTKNFQPRTYRRWAYGGRFHTLEAVVKETDLHILSATPLDQGYCIERVTFYRSQIEEYINYRDRRFLTELKPLAVEKTAPAIVKAMARAAEKAAVGPMAAVAGAVAQYVGKDILRRGCRDVIVENGGDIFLQVRRPVEVGLYAGDSPLSGKLRLSIKPQQTPLGICTSSGTVGHSLSFGKADAVVILARNACLADAVATAAANRVQAAEDLPEAVDFARRIRGVSGVVAVIGSSCASWGGIELIPGK